LTTAIRNCVPAWTGSCVPMLGESRKTTDCPGAESVVVPLPLSTRNVTVTVCGVLLAVAEAIGTDAVYVPLVRPAAFAVRVSVVGAMVFSRVALSHPDGPV